MVLHYLLKNKLIDGNTLTVTGKTLGENLERWVHERGELSMTSQDVIRPLENPIKSTGHLRYVRPFPSLRTNQMSCAMLGARPYHLWFMVFHCSILLRFLWKGRSPRESIPTPRFMGFGWPPIVPSTSAF